MLFKWLSHIRIDFVLNSNLLVCSGKLVVLFVRSMFFLVFTNSTGVCWILK